MSTEENKAVIRRYFVALNNDKSPATVGAYVDDDGLKQHIAVFEAAFPGYQLTAEDLIAEGDQVVVPLTVSATHKGDLMGIPPTGKQVTLAGIYIYRVRDGRIVGFRSQADMVGLLQQLGAMPAPGQPAS